MTPHKICLQAAQIHHTESLEAWNYCSFQGNSCPPLFGFLFEQTLWYLVRGEQTNQVTDVTKALFTHRDITTRLEVMSHFSGLMKNTLCVDRTGINIIHFWLLEHADSVLSSPHEEQLSVGIIMTYIKSEKSKLV